MCWRLLAFLSFLVAFFFATVFLLALDCPKAVHDVIGKLRANVHRKKPAADVLWNVGNAAAGFRLTGLSQRESVEYINNSLNNSTNVEKSNQHQTVVLLEPAYAATRRNGVPDARGDRCRYRTRSR